MFRKATIEKLILSGLLALLTLVILTACGSDAPRGRSSTAEQPTIVSTATDLSTIEATVPVVTSTATVTSALQVQPTEALQRPTFAGDRPTLPPTWTPTGTPTITDTPTITNTPTATFTLAPDEICEDIALNIILVNDATYSPFDEVQFVANLVDRTHMILLTFSNEDTGDQTTINLPGGQFYFGNVSLDLGSGPGNYRWSFIVRTPTYNSICELTGNFTLRPKTPLEIMFDTLDTLTGELHAAQSP